VYRTLYATDNAIKRIPVMRVVVMSPSQIRLCGRVPLPGRFLGNLFAVSRPRAKGDEREPDQNGERHERFDQAGC
jgi:hypothetical protein